MPSRIAITRLATLDTRRSWVTISQRDAVLGVELAEKVDDLAAGFTEVSEVASGLVA